MKNKAILFFILLHCFTAEAFSQQIRYTLDEAITEALKNNTNVKVSLLDVKKAQSAVSEAFGYALPSVDFTTQFSHFLKTPKTLFPDFEAMLTNSAYALLFKEKLLPEDDNKYLPMGYAMQTFSLKNNFESNFTVTQVLFNSAVFRGISASGIYLDLAKEKLNSTASKTTLEVKKAFYGVILSRELLKITEASLKNAEDNLSNIKALLKQGLVSEFDELQAEVQVENIKPKTAELKRTLADAKNGMKIVLGVEQQREIDVEGEILYEPEVLSGEEEIIDAALKMNLDIKTLILKRKVDEEMISIEKAGYWPTLTAFGNYSYAGASDTFNFQTYSSATVGLNLSINLFSGNRNYKRVEQASIATIQTDEQISLLKQALNQQVKSKLLEIKKVQSQIKALEKNVKLADKAYAIAQSRYSSGKGTQLEIKNADLELSAAKTNKLQSVYSYIISRAELDELMGRIDQKYIAAVQSKIEK